LFLDCERRKCLRFASLLVAATKTTKFKVYSGVSPFIEGDGLLAGSQEAKKEIGSFSKTEKGQAAAIEAFSDMQRSFQRGS